MKHAVYVIPCDSYEKVPEKLPILIENMGGLSKYIQPDQNVLLKPNLLMGAVPEKMVTTHPIIVETIGKMIHQQFGPPKLIDSPGAGYPYSEKSLKRTYEKTEMIKAAGNGNIELLYDTSHQTVSFSEGQLIKRFEIINPILDADVIINLCKFKTHMFMTMTGAVKNCFGAIPGLSKPGYHATLHDPSKFAGMLLDLADLVKPTLSIMDAVTGMEGNGPAVGKPRQIGYLIGSTNPLAIDVLVGEMMGLPPDKNPLLIEALKRNTSPNKLKDIEIIGPTIDTLKINGFKLPSTITSEEGGGRIPPFIKNKLIHAFKSSATIKPVIQKNKCIACGACVKACPMQVIDLDKRTYARINHKDCIRCYCCHEMCQENAIDLKPGLLYGLLNK